MSDYIEMSVGELRNLAEIKATVHKQVVDSLDLNVAQRMNPDQLRGECMERVQSLLAQQRRPISAVDSSRLIQEIMDEIFGLGPLEQFLRDPTVSDILANGPHRVYIEREGRLHRISATFRDNEHMLKIIQRIGSRVGRRIDESTPMLDARLPDGSRVNAAIPPLALDGPALSIRRFGTIPIGSAGIIEKGTITVEMADFLKAAVKCKLNIVVSGGTGTGKTTLLNALSHWIPSDERVVTIEDAAELQLLREHVVRLETRPPNLEGKGEVTQRDLLRNSLRMRPDRIIIGEVRGSETFDMLQAMNTGHEGSMTTVHANSPRDAISRIESMVSVSGLNIPTQAIREQIASSFDLLVHLSRVTGGRRRVTSISEVVGMEGSVVSLGEVFCFNQTGIGKTGHAEGSYMTSGCRPRVMARLESEGIHFPKDFFLHRKLNEGTGAKHDAAS